MVYSFKLESTDASFVMLFLKHGTINGGALKTEQNFGVGCRSYRLYEKPLSHELVDVGSSARFER